MNSVTPDKIAALSALWDASERILIVSHVHPDGDAAGSATALHHYLEGRRGRGSHILLPTGMPAELGFLDCGIRIAEDDMDGARKLIASADLVCCMDIGGLDRTGELEGALSAATCPKVLIDHHTDPHTGEFDLWFSETEVSSTCELLYRILMQMPDMDSDPSVLPPLCARSLMTGMTTDTNNFANSVFPGTLEMASELLAAGVDREAIIQHIYNEHRENRFRAMGHLLSERLEIRDGIAVMYLSKEDRERFGLLDGETDGFVNIPLGIAEVKISAFLREESDQIRMSLRSKPGVSVNGLASACFHGGGHRQASGGKILIPQDIPDASQAIDYFLKATARFMENPLPPTE